MSSARTAGFPGDTESTTATLFTKAALLLVVAVGIWLRLDQYLPQILLDDEWHAVHQLLSGKQPTDLLQSLGMADYSIPLALLYWLEARWFGLSEFGMRWPMLLAGIATLVAFPWWAWRACGPRVAVAFAALLATSPMLIIYTHTARPYALTLLLAGGAHVAFQHYLKTGWKRPAAPLAYCLVAPLCIWLHAVTGPFVVAPFIYEGCRALWQHNWTRLQQLIMLALPSGALTLLAIAPPLLGDPEALTGKAGAANIQLETLTGIWFMWLGTPSALCVAVMLLLSLMGLLRLLALRLVRWQIFGLFLTAATLLFMEPAWVNHSLTFGRYLLPALPLLLLATATGAVDLTDRARLHSGFAASLAGITLLGMLSYFLSLSPVQTLIQSPNSNMTHSRLQFDFRAAHNKMSDYQQAIPLSPFWQQLGTEPQDSLRIAVAPFYFETYNWDAVRWEQMSGQRVVPAYLTGFCVKRRWGEVPQDERFQFRNAYYVADLVDASGEVPDWLVYTKPFRGDEHGRSGTAVGRDLRRCLQQLRQQLGKPDYRDPDLIAYKLK